MENHFTLLGLSPVFDLDLQALETAYFREQKVYHPDRLAGKAATERLAAVQRSADINQAYHTLQSPLKRAQYLLHLQGIAVGTEADSIKPDMALLTEVMEWREAIAEGGDAAQWHKRLNDMAMQTTQIISSAYRDADWPRMAQATLRLGYILKTRDDVK